MYTCRACPVHVSLTQCIGRADGCCAAAFIVQPSLAANASSMVRFPVPAGAPVEDTAIKREGVLKGKRVSPTVCTVHSTNMHGYAAALAKVILGRCRTVQVPTRELYIVFGNGTSTGTQFDHICLNLSGLLGKSSSPGSTCVQSFTFPRSLCCLVHVA